MQGAYGVPPKVHHGTWDSRSKCREREDVVGESVGYQESVVVSIAHYYCVHELAGNLHKSVLCSPTNTLIIIDENY